ncbi:MAG: beta-ketoacyl synthase chain length factor [Deltaproteobacteria bacterium]|jgi:hypothetical protein|nr:beta-ketoacyl synthase chain length factor [Deltaproteobacteria bacterium]
MSGSGGLFAAIAGVGLAHSLGGLARLTSGDRAPETPTPPDTAELAAALPGVSLRRIPRYARMALLAALRALDDAGWRQEERRDSALVIGTAYSGVQMSMDFMDSILDDGPRLSSPTAFSHAVNNMGAGLLSLLLHMQGPCLTVSQFELSFAGAVCAAATLLHAGRARRVLVGAVDEVDERFTRCCPQLQKTGFPQTEGAVFLCLELPDPERPALRVRWERDARVLRPLFASGCARHGEDASCRHEHLYGHGPLAQALDTLLALHAVRNGTAAQAGCLCVAANGARTALIEIRGAQP